MSRSTSNIRVFPTFTDTSFFSGEDFTCTLTFRNVAEPSPSSSATSLSTVEGVKNGTGNSDLKLAGTEWMVEMSRSVSEGMPTALGARTLSSHSRSMSTVGQGHSDRPRLPRTQRSHGRSQSAAVSRSPAKSPKPEIPTSIAENGGTSNGVPPLVIDTNTDTTTAQSWPEDSNIPSPSPLTPSTSPFTQVNKLDLHSAIEDDASSETSSVSPSKAQTQVPTNLFNNFSPRSSIDIRDPDQESLPFSRGPRHPRYLPRSPLSQGSTNSTQGDTLMMGYAQLTGDFMIDEALIHASEFDAVKSRGVVSGKSGGGVVGVDAAQSGPWGGLGAFRSLNLGSFFGASQPSSLAEMRDRATSKTIPILSTPPSILFVDIRLLPGESRSFSYTFRLPRNLPPSHNGRALRISYSLVVTTQRPGQSAQHLSAAEIPFRLFSNLDEYCHQPKYDLKSPIILLRDQAKVTSLNPGEKSALPLPPTKKQPRMARRSSTYSDKPIESSQEEFLDFVDNLLGSLGKAPISATEPTLRLEVPRTPSPTPTRERSRHLSCREAIDVAVQRGRGPGVKSKIGVFEIGKNGVTVAKLTLPRTIYKLGETIEGMLQLGDSLIRCYQIRSTLESSEDIDPAVSVRSQSSVYRATRRVHGSKSEFTTFVRRTHFAFEIPTGAAPSFNTSSVHHQWSLRLEFLTSITPEPNPDEEITVPAAPADLLQLVDKDDRASTFMATETLNCDAFDCRVPIMVLPTNQEIPEDRVRMDGFLV